MTTKREETENCRLREVSLGSRRLVWDLCSCIYAVKEKKKQNKTPENREKRFLET